MNIENIVGWIVGGLSAIVAFFLKRNIKKVDELQRRIDHLEKCCVTTNELNDKFNQLDSKIDSTRNDITQRLDRIYDRMTEQRHG
jgi:hypothetical protein